MHVEIGQQAPHGVTRAAGSGDDVIDGGDDDDHADGGAGTDTCLTEETEKCEFRASLLNALP